MTEHLWKESMKSFGGHLDPEKDDQLKWIKIEIDNKVRRILKLIKSINQGNRDGNSKRKSELIQLVEDFHKEYQSLYDLYDDLKGEVREKVRAREADSSESSSTASSDSESFYSPNEVDSEASVQILETLDSEDAILKDKLTSTSVIKDTLNLKSITSFSKVNESGDMIKDLRIESEEREREEGLSSFTPKYQVDESRVLVQIKELESQVANLKLQLETTCTQKRELEEHMDCKATETKQLLQANLGLQAQILELETTYKEKADELSALLRTFEETEKQPMSSIQSLTAHAKNLQLEIDSLRALKGELEVEVIPLCSEKSDLKEQVISSKHNTDQWKMEREELQARIFELERTLTGRANELCALQKKIDVQENDMSAQIISLTSQVNHLQQELDLLLNEKSQLHFQLERERNEYSQRLTWMEKQKTKLTKKNTDQDTIRKEMEGVIDKLNQEHKQAEGRRFLESIPNLKIAEKKMEEMAEDFRKKIEDNIRLLSQRIRVAEQLQAENQDWFRDLKERMAGNEMGVRKMKDISLKANELLAALDTVAWKLHESSANFPNRISKVSCELMYAKDWVLRKNEEIKHEKEDLRGLLVQMDDKEGEILAYREKVWKLEYKLREMETMVKEKEEGMLGLKEEKREAIRQLCVWIDYHRSRCDYYKKILTEMNGRR